jgi:UDP-4-amino-4,6-dideoxy-N-acetyl-beta-L-altrosamine transaminase
MISYGRQDIQQTDIDSVVEVLRSDFLTQGPVVPRFEKAVADYCRTGYQLLHALAVNSATSALHIACLALDLKAGDWLWTTPITFVASANCACYCGANVDFVDIDPQTYNLCPKALRAKLMQAKAAGRLPKIVVPVHLTGQPCDMQAIHQLSLEYGFKIIEDASHAIGGKYQGEPIGNCQYSDITVFSFHPVKIITTAEGGMALTKNDHLANRMALFRSHGMTRDTAQMTHEPDGAWYYQQIELGYNYRLTELQAALGLSQMTRLDDYVSTRQKLANNYRELLAELAIKLPYQAAESYSAWHLYVIRLQKGTGKQIHKQVFDSLRSQGIGVNLHYIPVHTQPYYSALGQEVGYSDASFPLANQYYAEAISIPMYATLTFEQQAQIVAAIKTSFKQAGLL